MMGIMAIETTLRVHEIVQWRPDSREYAKYKREFNFVIGFFP